MAGRKNEPTPRNEIVVGMQGLVLLVPTDKVELLRMSFDYDFELTGACCSELPSDTAKQDDVATDVLQKRRLRLLENSMKVNDTERDSM